jgi:subtilisin-like proprotein convertase family protein
MTLAVWASTVAIGSAQGADLLPDLIIDGPSVAADMRLDRATIPGATLLRMPTVVANIGTGPLEINGGTSNSDGTQNVYQRIYESGGGSHQRLAGTFVFHPSHNHTHFEDFAQFRLRARNTDGSVGAVVRDGAKISFCLLDLQRHDTSLPGSPAISQYFNCTADRQGISVGWADIYHAGLPDQWIDITGMAPGQYWVEVISDPANHMLEINENNNSAFIPYTIGPFVDNAVVGAVYDDRNINGAFDAGDVALAGAVTWLDIDSDGVRDNGTTTVEATQVPADIRDLTTVRHELEVAGMQGVITDLWVTVRLTHTYDRDLALSLISPSGRKVLLVDNLGGSGNDFYNTVFTDLATTPIINGSPPFTGHYRPLQPLSLFKGQSPNGHWKLEIADQTGGDVGKLLAWSMAITWSEPTATSNSGGGYRIGNWSDGSFTVRAQRQSGWVGPTPASYPVSLVGGTVNNGTFFGFWRENVVFGVVYEDFNRNLRRDPGEEGLAGWRIYDDANSNGRYDSGVVLRVSNDIPKAITDHATVVSTINVNGLLANIRDLDVHVDLLHTYVSDLKLTLVAPSGRRVTLFNRHGGSGDHLITRFNDEAATDIASGTPPYAGSFKPLQPLSAVDRTSPNGLWRLEVADLAVRDVGTLRGWSLRIDYGEFSTVTSNTGRYVLGELRPGTYRIREVDQPGYTRTVPAAGFYQFVFTNGGAGVANFGNYPGELAIPFGDG